MRTPIYRPILFSALFYGFFHSVPVAAQQRTPPEFINWLPVTDTDRQMKNPVVEKEAGAEVLLWRVHVVDDFLGDDLQRVFYHYVRVKVFDSKGKERVGSVDLPYRDPERINDVAGRTIKPDGSVLELDRKAVYKRDLVRAGGLKQKVMSFAMPGVEEGAIVEYRWKQTQNDNRFRYLRLQFSRDLPVQRVTYFLRPLPSEFIATSDRMFLLPFNCKTTPLADRDGWSETSVVNIPADRDEPYAPSDANLHPWALLYYRSESRDAQKYWNDEARQAYNDFKDALKSDAQSKAAVAEAAAQAKTDDEKIQALIMYVRSRLRGFSSPAMTDAEREEFLKKLPKNRPRNSTEIFRSGIALSSEMNIAFGALAAQAGFDVRPALVASRFEVVVDPRRIADSYFVDATEVAVKAGDSWKVLNVSDRDLLPGLLPADEEGTFAVIADPKSAILQGTPVSPPNASSEVRTATLKLSLNGTLSGDVRESYSGHRAGDYRSNLTDQSPAQRETYFHDRIIRMFPDADVSGLKIENVEDASKPLLVSYHLEAPFFAQGTGKRILFEPNAFRRSAAILFSASERRYPIEFPYAWREQDTLQIELPPGFDLESAENPGGFAFGDAGEYKLSMGLKQGASTVLVVSRELTFGAKELVRFEPSIYPNLKRIFDEVRLRDTHSLSLREN